MLSRLLPGGSVTWAADLTRFMSALGSAPVPNSVAEVQTQNRELISSLIELRTRQGEPGQPRGVLLIDDQETSRYVLRQMPAGYGPLRVQEAATSTAAGPSVAAGYGVAGLVPSRD